MQHLVAIGADRPKIFDGVDLSRFALKNCQRCQMMDMNVVFSDLTVRSEEIEPAYTTERTIGLDTRFAVLGAAFVSVNKNGGSVSLLRVSGRCSFRLRWRMPIVEFHRSFGSR